MKIREEMTLLMEEYKMSGQTQKLFSESKKSVICRIDLNRLSSKILSYKSVSPVLSVLNTDRRTLT